MSWKSLSKFRSEIMGLACLWVMFHHNAFDWPNALEALKRFSLYGNLGVDIFLLLSGVGLYYAWAKQPKLSGDKLMALGWKPEVDLPEMFRRLAASFRAQEGA